MGKFGLKNVPKSIILVSSLAELLENWCNDDQCRTNCRSSLVCNSWPKNVQKVLYNFFLKIPFGVCPQPEGNYGFIDSQFFLQPRSCFGFVETKYGCQGISTFEGKSNNLWNYQLKDKFFLFDTCLEENFYPLIIEDLQFIFGTKLHDG